MLLGEYIHTLDLKGRVIIPSKFRDDLGESFIVTKGLDNSLFIYSKEEWKKFEDKLKTLPMTNSATRNFVRFFFAGATECELDKQGRITLPQNLREYASLMKDVCIIGVSTRVEIWDKERWDNYTNPENMDLDDIANQMSNLGI
ncbi:MAG: division/cell wall cluster transcriptional repressor MraZ [Clostridia bacterium]|nr:division/cell wall cluster transcriptional repressor MraZ [Clostridia bacterium]